MAFLAKDYLGTEGYLNTTGASTISVAWENLFRETTATLINPWLKEFVILIHDKDDFSIVWWTFTRQAGKSVWIADIREAGDFEEAYAMLFHIFNIYSRFLFRNLFRIHFKTTAFNLALLKEVLW